MEFDSLVEGIHRFAGEEQVCYSHKSHDTEPK
jgi:hypothetical protein